MSDAPTPPDDAGPVRLDPDLSSDQIDEELDAGGDADPGSQPERDAPDSLAPSLDDAPGDPDAAEDLGPAA